MKKSISSDTLDSDSSSSQRDSSTTSPGIPPMPIRKMKELTAVSSENELTFHKNNEDSNDKKPQLTGFKLTNEGFISHQEPILTKEELKNRELEKVKQAYAQKTKEEDGDKFNFMIDDVTDSSAFNESDNGSVSSGNSFKKSEDKKNLGAQLIALTKELEIVGEEDVLPLVLHFFYSFIRCECLFIYFFF